MVEGEWQIIRNKSLLTIFNGMLLGKIWAIAETKSFIKKTPFFYEYISLKKKKRCL
jgi:hypothetical protein